MNNRDWKPVPASRRRSRPLLQLAGVSAFAALIAASAIVTKEATARRTLEPLAAVAATVSDGPNILTADMHDLDGEPTAEALWAAQIPAPVVDEAPEPVEVEPAPAAPVIDGYPAGTRFFNGRPVRPARTIKMRVTAYSPDEQSCAGTADGITSSIHNVFTNGMRLVAADSRILPLGSIISVPGYDQGKVVPVLDRGGAIKGRRLDVLYATHEQALKWGVKDLEITVWEYADGQPADDYRKFRDSKH